MGFYEFAVDNAADGGNIEACHLGNVFKHHGTQVALVPVQEVVVLVIQNGAHGLAERILALLEGFNEPFCRIQFLFYERCRFLLRALGRTLGIQKQVCIFLVYPYFGNVEAGHSKVQYAVVLVEDEVRYNLLGLIDVRVFHLSAR